MLCITKKKGLKLHNKCKFVTLRRLLIILSIIFFSAQYAEAQNRNNPIPGSTEKILKFYPNPATSIITFDFVKSYQKGYMLQVFNFLGKPVFESPNVPTKTTLNLSDFTRGVYIYQLRDQTGKILESGKFQVSK